VSFGREPLSHLLLIDTIENEFVPLAIHNNKPGRDREILERYNEPAWNNPVLRFLDGRGQDLLPRRGRIWSTGDVAPRLVAALRAAGRDVPGYLRLAAAETGTKETESAHFAMHCFWVGEARLGAIDGVLTTRAAWMEGHEIVEVIFDPHVVDYDSLVRNALKLECASKGHK